MQNKFYRLMERPVTRALTGHLRGGELVLLREVHRRLGIGALDAARPNPLSCTRSRRYTNPFLPSHEGRGDLVDASGFVLLP